AAAQWRTATVVCGCSEMRHDTGGVGDPVAGAVEPWRDRDTTTCGGAQPRRVTERVDLAVGPEHPIPMAGHALRRHDRDGIRRHRPVPGPDRVRRAHAEAVCPCAETGER